MTAPAMHAIIMGDKMGSQKSTWKHAERKICRLLGLEHLGGVSGRSCPDGRGSWLVAEVKHREKLGQHLLQAMGQAEGYAGEGQLPVVVLHQRGQRYLESLVVMRLGDFRDWFGDGRDAT